jgi:hypothetical protein
MAVRVAFGDSRLPERFWGKVQVMPSGCWEWRGFISAKGYGVFNGRKLCNAQHAHRVALIVFSGESLAGLETDHLCRNRRCVNPEHLEAVTRYENQRRSPISMMNVMASKTHCVNGHEFTPENTGHSYGGKARRVCIQCRRQKIREYCRVYDRIRRPRGVPRKAAAR